MFFTNFDKATFLINDDSLLNMFIVDKNLVSGEQIVPYMSSILGYLLNLLQIKAELSISVYGIFLFITNLAISFGTINFLNYTMNQISKLSIILFNLFTVPINILSPTFTITSILATGTGIIGSILYFKFGRDNWFTYLFYFLIIVIGFLIRPEAFLGAMILTTPVSLFILMTNLEKKKIKKIMLSFLFLTFGLIIILEHWLSILAGKNNLILEEFVKFNSMRSFLSYTPAFLKMQQEIISGNIMQGIWTNVDFILLRDWAYADNSVYNSQNLSKAISSLPSEFGISGLINSEFGNVWERLYLETQSFHSIIFILILIAILSNILARISRYQIVAILLLVLTYILAFYYLSALLRLPARTIFPFILLPFLLFSLILNSDKIKYSKKVYTLFAIYLVLIGFILSFFHLNNEFGFKKIRQQNEIKLINSKKRDAELMNFSNSATYIGPVSFMPISTDLAYSNNFNLFSNERSLPISWATFSPLWRSKAIKLNLDPDNVYNSLATKEDVYWVSDSRIAEILDMYMNDHKIYRGKLCSVAKLSGPDQAEVFTYQAKENDC